MSDIGTCPECGEVFSRLAAGGPICHACFRVGSLARQLEMERRMQMERRERNGLVKPPDGTPIGVSSPLLTELREQAGEE